MFKRYFMGKKKKNKKKHIYDGTYDRECIKEEHDFGRIGKLTGQGQTNKVSNRRNETNISTSSDVGL